LHSIIFIELLHLSLFLRFHLPFDVDIDQLLLAWVQLGNKLRVENFVITSSQRVKEGINFDKKEYATLPNVSICMIDYFRIEVTLVNNCFEELFIVLCLPDF
jgi:hypothetical protein